MSKPILLIFILLTSITLFFQRHIFFDTYNPEYMHNLYSFSQWSVPLSSRVMGDANLFSYSGYNLIQDFKPYSINPETPIFAKLFFGLSIYLFNNAHYASLLFLILLLVGMDLLAKNHFQFNKTKRILLAILIFCSAEIQEQLKLHFIRFASSSYVCLVLNFSFQTQISSKKATTFCNSIAGILLRFYDCH
jgi:hypothetical protein